MSDRLDLRSRIQIEGVFWDVREPDTKFSGIVNSDGRHIEFSTSAEMVSPERSFLNPDQGPIPDIVHGFTTQGPCTLVGFHELVSPGLVDLPNNRAVRTRKYRVSACIVGCYLESDTKPALSSAWFSCSGVEEWLPGIGTISLTEQATTVSFPRQLPTVLDLCVLANRTRISIKIASNFQYTPGGRRYGARSEPLVKVELLEPRSLRWFVDLAYRFENFFSLCLGTSVRLKTVSLEGQGSESGWLIQPRSGKAERPNLQVWTRGDASQLAAAIAAWLSTPEEFRPLENLIYGTIRHSSLFVETEFLSLAQAIESLHRLTDNTTIVAPTFFKQLLRPLCRVILEKCGNSAIATRLLDSIRHANEPGFQNRIQSLLARLTPDHVTKLLGDPVVFEQVLRQTRNYFTHPGIPQKSKVITDAKELFLFNQKLHAFLRLLMLLNIGFAEQSVFEPIYYQSRKWT